MRLSTLILGHILILVGGCLAEEEITAADRAITNFHNFYEKDDARAAYQSTHHAFREKASEADLKKVFALTQAELGKIHAKEIIGIQKGAATNTGRHVTVICKTTFERGKALEYFTFTRNDPPQLLNYRIVPSRDHNATADTDDANK